MKCSQSGGNPTPNGTLERSCALAHKFTNIQITEIKQKTNVLFCNCLDSPGLCDRFFFGSSGPAVGLRNTFTYALVPYDLQVRQIR